MVHPKQDAAGLPTRAKHDEIVELTDKDLAEVAAGKTVSWAYDDEAPAPSISSVIGCLVRAVVAGTGM